MRSILWTSPAVGKNAAGLPLTQTLARLQDPETPVRRFRATDSLLEFLKMLWLCAKKPVAKFHPITRKPRRTTSLSSS